MDIASAKTLKSLVDGQKERDELLKILGIKHRGLAYVIKNLKEAGYIDKENTTVKLKNTPKATLLKDVSHLVDIEKLLRGSNEIIFSNIEKCNTVEELIKKTGLSKTTIHRSISELQSIGAIIKNNGKMQIDERKESLMEFANMMRMEMEKKYEDDNVEIIFNDGSTILRKTPVGKIIKGATTGFSLFSEYGVEYNTKDDYFCEQEEEMDIQDVLLHAVYSAVKTKNKMELLMCVIFYAKHKEKMDTMQLRKKSIKLGILDIWLDIESYMREKMPKTELFLPWNEFLIKAKLYEIPTRKYTLPKPSDIFREISDELKKPFTVYLIGGENMRIKSLKSSTKDCDIVVENNENFENMAQILIKIGYEQIAKQEFVGEDLRIEPDGMFKYENKSTIDLFTHRISRELILSKGMIERSDVIDYGKLKVKLLRNEDIFLLKAVTGREGDIQDMAALVKGSRSTPYELQHGDFDWKLVWEEILEQKQTTKTDNFMITVLDQLTYLEKQSGIASPFFDKLRINVIDIMIEKIIRGGKMPIKKIVDYLSGEDITETQIRNRLDEMEKKKIIKKVPSGRTASVKFLKNSEFPENELKINIESLEQYMDWRFHMRNGQSRTKIEKVISELTGFGFKTIGEIDGIVEQSIEALEKYEREQLPNKQTSRIGAIRICIGMRYPKIGRDKLSPYHISKFEEYHKMIKNKSISTHPKKTMSRE
ncbi:MAG: hypothetical protein EB830_01490 [Nitrosopumilus sp. H13]|nr:MAG: hypothetical protein EB830_01490 [Nitrosopumilus sp. H13]